MKNKNTIIFLGKLISIIGFISSIFWFQSELGLVLESADKPKFAWEPAIFGITAFLTWVTMELKYKSCDSEKNISPQEKCCHDLSCPIDDTRKSILSEFNPELYLPLKKNFYNLSCDCNGIRGAKSKEADEPLSDINILPYGGIIEKPEFDDGKGYRFNGSNMISVQANRSFPYAREARTFVFAVFPTSMPSADQPMFFFSYGQRKVHECGANFTNHDKSFGVFWGQPAPDEEIEQKYKGMGIRVFFYCEHLKEDRTSENCDTPVLCELTSLNEWHVLSVVFDGKQIRFYKNSHQIHCEDYSISTSETIYMNIGGFVHHNEKGAMIATDIDYSMNGYIREFMMFRKALSDNEVKNISREIEKLIR